MKKIVILCMLLLTFGVVVEATDRVDEGERWESLIIEVLEKDIGLEDISESIEERGDMSRGIQAEEWYYTKSEVRWRIEISEALIKLSGASEELLDNYYNIYRDIADVKMSGELVSIRDGYGVKVMNQKFWPIVLRYGVNRPQDFRVLGKLLYGDGELIRASGRDSLLDKGPYPYVLGEYTRENLLTAGVGLVGRVRYVWGGGHFGTASIRGVNPLWYPFYEGYGKKEGEEGFNRSIVPKESWSPILGEIKSGHLNLFDRGETVRSVEEYHEKYDELLGTLGERSRSLKLASGVIEFNDGLHQQRLEGLDCSGLTSWMYNQVDLSREYRGLAGDWVKQNGFREVRYGSKLLPGDLISWESHIVMVVGEYVKGSGNYLVLESAPNMVKFGVAHYSGSKHLDEVAEYAKELNSRIGGIPEEEEVKRYNLRSLREQVILGRSLREFDIIDADISEFEVRDIMEVIIERLPEYRIER